MQIGLRQFDAGTVQWLIGAVKDPDASRSSLARGLCERLGWKGSSGALAVASARKVLPRLADKLGITLPAAGPGIPSGQAMARPSARACEVRCALEDLGAIRLVPVEEEMSRRRWEAMIDTWHPLGWARAPGGQMLYWISSSVFGVLGAIGFSAASWHQKARDTWIGWSDDARVAHLGDIVCNHRFMLCPWVHVPNLASSVLAMASSRIVDDWQAAYGRRPLVAYTYVAPEHTGTCYAAAGWSRCDEPTSGMPPGKTTPGPQRGVWMKPLAPDWKAGLCAAPGKLIEEPLPVYLDETADWVDHEYARCRHTDGRVRERIRQMGRSWLKHPGASLPVVFPDKAELKAAYRLLSNDRVTMEHILESHQAATAERCAPEKVVLAIQDTTALNYNGLEATKGLVGLVGLGGPGKGVKGLMAHFGLAVNLVGRPLGVFSLDADFRHDAQQDEKESRRWVEGLERAGELAAACRETRVITVCDREGDIWTMFRKAVTTGAGLLVRASRGRSRRVITEDGSLEDLWDHVAGQPSLASKTIVIDACGGPRSRKKRSAKLDLRACTVTLAAPNDAGDKTATRMLAVSATETSPAHGREPLPWLLLTTEGKPSAEQAREVVAFYERRWSIETWFSVLKTGTRVEDRQLDDADDLRKCLVFDAITACHIHELNFMARTAPQIPTDEVVDRDMIDCLYDYLHILRVLRARAPPGHRPDIRTFVVDLARTADFNPTKHQPLPGTGKLWEAWMYFKAALILYRGLKQRKDKLLE